MRVHSHQSAVTGQRLVLQWAGSLEICKATLKEIRSPVHSLSRKDSKIRGTRNKCVLSSEWELEKVFVD